MVKSTPTKLKIVIVILSLLFVFNILILLSGSALGLSLKQTIVSLAVQLGFIIGLIIRSKVAYVLLALTVSAAWVMSVLGVLGVIVGLISGELGSALIASLFILPVFLFDKLLSHSDVRGEFFEKT